MLRVTQFMRRSHPGAYSIERLYRDVRSFLPETSQVELCVNQRFSQGLIPRVLDAFRARRYQSDVNHVTGDVHYLTYFLDKRRTILTIHDCEMLFRSSGIHRFVLWFFWFWLPEKCTEYIVVVSAETKAQLLKVLRCNPKKVTVIHNPISSIFQKAPKPFNMKKPRLLQIGTKKNKNIERLVEAIAGLDVVLAIVGKLSDSQIDMLQNQGIQYENLVNLSDQELLEEYQYCDLLVFVSTCEGFGLPIVEAQTVGRPVVTSNISSMPEVAGEGACYVNPFDITSIRAGISKVIEDADYRRQLVELGQKNAVHFQVDKVSKKYSDLYQTVSDALPC